MKSPTARETLDRAMREASQRYRGLPQMLVRMGAARQTELGVANTNNLPVQVVPGGAAMSGASGAPGHNALGRLNAAGQSADGARFYLEGYSAPAGSPEALPDGTGRGGDVALRLLALGQSATLGVASLAVLVPLFGAGVCVANGSGIGLTNTLDLAAAGVCVAAGYGDFAEPADPMARGVCICLGTGGLSVLTPLAGAGVGVALGLASVTVMTLSAASVCVCRAQSAMTVRTPLAAAGICVADTAATLAPASLLLAAATAGVCATAATLAGSFGFGDAPPVSGP